MSLLQILSQTIIKNNPEYHKLSSKHQSKIIKQTYQHIFKTALNEVEIPQPKDIIQRKIEEKQYERHSDKYREKVKLLDYDFIDKLRTLREYRLSRDTLTDSESIKKISSPNTQILAKKSSSSNKQLDKPSIDFSGFSNTNYHSKRSLFKPDLDDEIFKNNTTIRNYITRTKFKLEQSLNEIYFTEGQHSELIYSPKKTERGIHVSKSLFQLYELFIFLDFIKKLEKKIDSNIYEKFYNEIQYSYEILFSYFLQWLEKNGKKITKISEFENEILNNENFMNLDYINPLFEGFTMLLENNIDMNKVKEFLNDPGLVKTFVAKLIDSKTNTIILKKPKSIDLDYEYEVIKFLSSEKIVKESDLRRRFLMYSLSITKILLKLEDLHLIKRKKISNDNLITFLT